MRASLNLKRDKRDKRDFKNVSYLICPHYEKHKKLAEDIDAIKGPLYAHGIAIYMRRMGTVATSRNSEGVRLGIGPTLVVVVPSNAIYIYIYVFINICLYIPYMSTHTQ